MSFYSSPVQVFLIVTTLHDNNLCFPAGIINFYQLSHEAQKEPGTELIDRSVLIGLSWLDLVAVSTL